MSRWQRFWHLAPTYLRSVAYREWQLALLALGGLAPGVAALIAWLQLAMSVRVLSTNAIIGHSWLVPTVLVATIGPEGVLVGAGVVTTLIGGLGLANAYLASVDRRRGELALMVGLGLSRWEVTGLLLLEAMAAGLLGSGVGAILGLGLSRASWPAARIYFGLSPSFQFHPAALALGIAAGMLAALLFMGVSARALMGLPTLAALRDGKQPALMRDKETWRIAVYGTLCAGLLTAATAFPILGLRSTAILTGLALGLSSLLSGGGWLLTRIFLGLPTPTSAPLWTLAVQGLARHPRHTAGMTLALTTASYGIGLAALAWLDGSTAAAFPFWVAGAVLVAAASLVFTAAGLAALERRQEFGLLSALGARAGRIRRLVLLEYGIVAAGGGSLGGLMALVNWAIAGGRGSWWQAIAIVLCDLLAALLSAWIGAAPVLWRLARRTPGRALRGESRGEWGIS